MKTFTIFIISLLILFFSLNSALTQTKSAVFTSPKYSISVTLGYDYTFASANGEVNGFNISYDPGINRNVFSSSNYGMQQGGSIDVTGRMLINKQKGLNLIGSLGYNLFYHTENGKLNRTKWNIFSLGAGAEYNLRKYSKSRAFINFAVNYNLIFGAWQTDVTFPDNTMSNIYIKFKPQSRLGITLGTGAEFTLNKRTSIIAGIKGVWANIAPKENHYTTSGYEAFMNDSKNYDNITFGSSKQMIYMQLFSGVSFKLF